jgi:hypothetical protein
MAFNNLYVRTGKTPNLESIYAISLYDPKNGKILHMHHVLNMEHSSNIEPQQLEKDVVAFAEKLGHNVKRLKVLHTHDLQDMTLNYRVDVNKKTLVKVSESEFSKPSSVNRR